MAVCGASGGIGQPMSLLLKQSPLVTELSLYDIVHTPGVAAGEFFHKIQNASSFHQFIEADITFLQIYRLSTAILFYLSFLCVSKKKIDNTIF